ncbi:MAG: hypothetical protein QOF39_1972 [Frankiales bacterium]|jgi:hypothetical protein|nr:hypothetical protein [Frankiales bacterium]
MIAAGAVLRRLVTSGEDVVRSAAASSSSRCCAFGDRLSDTWSGSAGNQPQAHGKGTGQTVFDTRSPLRPRSGYSSMPPGQHAPVPVAAS